MSVQELEIIGSHLRQLQLYADEIEGQIKEVTSALENVDEIQEVEEGSELLVPLTNGIFVKAKFSDATSFVVNTGAGVILEKDATQTKDMLIKQKESLEKYHDQVMQEITMTYKYYLELELSMSGGK